MTDTIESRLEVMPTALAVREVGGWLALSLASLEPTAALLARAELAVHEACMNVIDHGGLPEGARISLELEASAACLTVRIIDPGTPFDPSRAAALPVDPERERGYGLTIIRSLTTDVSYRRVDDVNELKLRMEIGGDDA